ncbi:hypothetical protein GOV06_05600 [Candidatus Woesearchaeota archaeon]|nr:hypothetical protein [Candidatus Woesearchaeota archaeon]
MDKKIVYGLVIVIVLLSSFVLIKFGPSITSATVAGQTKCVGARAALKFINEKNCTRIYESAKCEEQGLVEVKC